MEACGGIGLSNRNVGMIFLEKKRWGEGLFGGISRFHNRKNPTTLILFDLFLSSTCFDPLLLCSIYTPSLSSTLKQTATTTT